MSEPAIDVAHVVTRFIGGGSERRIAQVIDALGDVEFRHHLILGAEHDPARLPVVASVTVVDDLVREVQPPRDLRAFRRLRRVLHDRQFDVVHTCQSKAGILGRLAAPKGATIVHSVVMATFGHGTTPLKSWVYASAERFAGRRTDAYVVVGNDLACTFRRARVGRGREFVVIRSALDIDRLAASATVEARRAARTELDLPGDTHVVAYVGALTKRKGVLELPAIVDDAHRRRGGDTILLVAGEGPERGELERRLRHDVRFHSRLLGHVEDVCPVLSASDVVVLPSAAEGLSQVLVQATACGRPWVAFGVHGAQELIDLGASGVIADDQAAFAAAVAAPPNETEVVDLSEWQFPVVASHYRSLFTRIGGGM